ncbi:MFS general substrate transporter [Leucogyrophana mollusca]|uniref:MFS general substrate transporter n=1 Tax=Leucogyrophana mollusca TaxID=85980 RepID=A0ACB8BIW0_9AGAM|nr:MFS general substrate transporter [Leucogyrophana mollusca]
MSEKSTPSRELADENQQAASDGGSSHPNLTPDEQTLHEQTSGKLDKYLGEAPDGGFKAWSVVVAIALCTFSTFGYVNAWGVFQAYYEENLLSDSTPSNIAWIGSVQYALCFLPGLVTGRLFDLGYFKIPYFIASCLVILCTFLIAECTQYWQFFLCQGVGVGLACGIVFGPALGIVSHWFKKRRGLALGITAIGSSCGGTLFPVAAQNLFPLVGFKWSVRIFGFMLLLTLGISNILIDRRLPPVNVTGGLFNWAALRNPAYAVYCLSGCLTFLGLYTVLTYIPVSAELAGVNSDFAFYLIAIANASSAFGRLTAGLLADKVGALNIMTPFTAVAGILTFGWPFARSQGSLIGIAVVYGFSCGAYVSLLAAPAIAMGDIGDVGRRVGMFMSFAAIGALAGPPISGAINDATGGFEDVGYYAGGIVIFSVGLLLLTRYLHLGHLWGKF